MKAHVLASLSLLLLTFVLCSILYPLTVLGIGHGLFPTQASGSMVTGLDAIPVGSRLIAQEFKSEEWFQSRPSAASYNAAASSGSNWGANNPKLRSRAAQQLGPIVSYRSGARSTTVQQDIEQWFQARPDRLMAWVNGYPSCASTWLEDSANVKAVTAWTTSNPGDFFTTFADKHPGAFPLADGETIRPITKGTAICATFFDMWLQDNPDLAKLIDPIPADAVMASASGLDPHITVANALSQLDRVVTAWSTKRHTDQQHVREIIKQVLKEKAFQPLGGLAGSEPLVNVLEVNLEMAKRL